MTSTTTNFGSYFGSSPRTPQWFTNLPGLLPLFTRPRSTKLMTSNFELSKNGSPTSLVPSTSSFTRYGNWKQKGTLTTNSHTCASPLPSSCASSWPAWQAGFPPFGQRTFEQLKALRTRTTHSNWWTQSNFKMTSSPTRLFHRPSNPDSLLALNPDSQATIITTAFKLRTDRTDRRRTRSSDAATITATTSLIFNGTTTNDGGTGNSGEEPEPQRQTSQQTKRVGGRLQRFLDEWQAITSDHNILDAVKGFRIPFQRRPPVSRSHPPTHPWSQEVMEVMDKEVSDLMAKGAIEYASGPGFTSPLFTIPKKTGELRPVLNLRALNQFLPSKHFKMETIQHVCQLINPGDYLTSIDLRDAFLHVPMHQSSRKFLQFRWRDRLYQFKVLPFGLSLAPLVFTKVLRPLLQWARSKGIRISAYLDDLIIVAATKELSLEATRLVLNKLERLGFLVKESKSSLTPSTTLQHLGFEIDTVSMSLKVPGQKIRDLRREASKLINKTTCTIRQLASFIGKAVAMTAAVFPARLKVQRLLAVKIQALKSGASWSDLISIPQEATAELLWWRTNLQQWNGQSWIVANPQVDIYTDASSSGWGVVINNKSHSGIWNTQQQSRHINYKELLTVFIALKRPSVQGRTVNIISDNVTTIAYINHFGGTRSPELMRLATTLWNWCLSTGTRISTTYVPSAFNPADAPSRRLTGQLEWAIDRKFFRRLDQQWGPHHVDLFASPINHHLPRYMTWKPSEGAVGHDALQHLWKPLGNVYLCPPWNLISPALQKIKQEKIMATIITPHWPSAVWFPTIKAMTTAPPIHIPRHQVLPAPGNAPDILEKNPHWSLCAWRINGAASWTRAGTTTRPPL